MLCQPLHLGIVCLRCHAGFMRMQSGAGKDPVMLLGDLQRTVVGSWPGAAADGENALQSGFTRAREHFCAIRVEFVAFNVGVGIDVHTCSTINDASSGTWQSNPTGGGSGLLGQ